jgi:hypothetical protein
MIKPNFLVLIRDRIAKIRPIIVGVFILAFSVAPLLTFIPKYRESIVIPFSVVLLYLFFDIYRELKERLDKIDMNLKEPQPPSYSDFNEALPIIKGILDERLSRDQDVTIRILAVSAQFSWKVLIETTIPQLLTNKNYKSKIHIELVIVKPSVLHEWGQRKLENDAKSTLIGEENFKRKYKTLFQEGKLSLFIHQYDNIPHWHGILIDNDLLFMGRCKWEVIDGRYHLLVGQIDYRQFRINDRFGGNTRIELINSWFDAYKFRATKTNKII